MEFSARYTLAGLFVLATIFAVFAFIYWLTNSAGLGETAPYRIRFTVPVSGLSNGSDVLFNGIKVGEVTALRFDPSTPEATVVDIDLSTRTPVRADTTVGIAFQGLTGAASILMTGGSADAGLPATDAHGIPTLTADPQASRSWTDNAGRVLGRLDDMLARNSGRFDTILSGLERLAGGGDGGDDGSMYDLPVPQLPPRQSGGAQWQLTIAEPTILLSLNTDGLLVRGSDGALSEMEGAQWTDNLPNLVQAKIIRAFEDAGYADSVARPADVFDSQFRLAVDIRTFHLAAGAPPEAEGEFMAKLLDRDGRTLASERFAATLEAGSIATPDVVEAMRGLFLDMTRDLVEWTLAELPAHTGEPQPAE